MPIPAAAVGSASWTRLGSSAPTVFARLAVDSFKRDVVLIPGSVALRDPVRGGANIVIPLRVSSGV